MQDRPRTSTRIHDVRVLPEIDSSHAFAAHCVYEERRPFAKRSIVRRDSCAITPDPSENGTINSWVDADVTSSPLVVARRCRLGCLDTTVNCGVDRLRVTKNVDVPRSRSSRACQRRRVAVVVARMLNRKGIRRGNNHILITKTAK